MLTGPLPDPGNPSTPTPVPPVPFRMVKICPARSMQEAGVWGTTGVWHRERDLGKVYSPSSAPLSPQVGEKTRVQVYLI